VPLAVALVHASDRQTQCEENAFFGAFKARRGLINALRRLRLLPLLARLFEWDLTRNTREEVNVYTYRTPDTMLSSAQDYRSGYGGDQQHVWQATLGPDAVCFTTHPPRREGRSPAYWVGSGVLPRVAQVENVLIAVYDIHTRPGLYVTNRLLLTHAWLPRDRFDEVVERDGWLFARRGNGYLALRSQHPYHWQTEPGEDQGREVIVPGWRNSDRRAGGRAGVAGGRGRGAILEDIVMHLWQIHNLESITLVRWSFRSSPTLKRETVRRCGDSVFRVDRWRF